MIQLRRAIEVGARISVITWMSEVRTASPSKPVDAVEFCKRLLNKTGVLFLPGDKGFGKDFAGYVRIGFVPETDVVKAGFEALDRFMKTDFEDVPTM